MQSLVERLIVAAGNLASRSIISDRHGRSCTACLGFAAFDSKIPHEGDCLIGKIFDLISEIQAERRSAWVSPVAPDRHIEYADGGVMAHEQAAAVFAQNNPWRCR